MKNLDNKFVEQAKWILTPDNINCTLDCPLVSGCSYCIVHDYNRNVNGCTIKRKIEAAKHYLRIEKLKRISK